MYRIRQSICLTLTVQIKCKLPSLVSFLTRCVLFLLRWGLFLLSHILFLLRINEVFIMEYNTHKNLACKTAACVLQQKKNECEIFLLEVSSCFLKMHTNVCTNNKGFSSSLNSGNAHKITHKCVYQNEQ